MMSKSLTAVVQGSQSVVDEHAGPAWSVRVDRLLGLVRQAMADTGYTVDALAAALSEELGRPVDKGFLWRMLNGERPMPMVYLVALPADTKVRFAQLSAEACGWTVVRPAASDAAAGLLVAGLLGLLRRDDGQTAAGRPGLQFPR